LVDHLQNAIEVLVYVSVRHAHDKKSERFEHFSSRRIARNFSWRRMRYSVDFDYQLTFNRYKVDDVPVDRMLPPKFPMGQAPTP